MACKNQHWTNFSSYRQSSFLARISTFSGLLICFKTKSYVDSLTDCRESPISVSVEEVFPREVASHDLDKSLQNSGAKYVSNNMPMRFQFALTKHWQKNC